MKEKALIVIKWTLDIVFIIILSLMYYLNQPVYTKKVVFIPKGSINRIITHLQERNFNVTKLDAFLLRIIGSPQSGWIDMGETKLTRGDFLYKLTRAKAALEDVTLIPGETTYVFLHQLSEKLSLDVQKLQKYYNEKTFVKEGAFVPNSYKVPVGIAEQDLIALLLYKSKKQMVALSKKLFGTYNEKKWIEYLCIASVIQKESASIKEMPLVSSVIHNRIKKGMKLQMDGTLNYGKYSHIKVTPYRIRNDKSIYNTYKIAGVPKIPVCNVSFDAIKAAIFPAKTNYLYFMKSKSGKHDFACNYSTHLRNIRRATK